MSTVGLPWEGSNKQARMRFALESASPEEAIDAVERLLELLSIENGAFIRAIEGTLDDDERQIARAVTDIRSVLQSHGLDLDNEGRLFHEISEATEAAPAPRPSPKAATDTPPVARDTVTSTTEGTTMTVQPANARSVFLVHGRDKKIKSAMTELLRAFDLRVIDWEEAAAAAKSGSPSTLEIVHAGMRIAHGVVVLFTADDLGQCKEEFWAAGDGSDERDMTGQARQNVMFEAGMAIGIDQKRTVLVHHGRVRWNSDLQSVNYVPIDDSHQSRLNLGLRLRTAGLTVHLENSHFSNAGDFSTPTASHTDSSDPTSQPEPPPGLKADINTMLEWMYDPTQRGKLQQLIRGRARDLDKAVNALELPSNGLDQTALLSHYDSLYKLSAPIVELLQQGVSHDREGSHADVWSGALQQMMRIRRPAVMPAGQMIQRLPPERFSRARHVPAMLTLRTIGLTAVLASRDR